jgi:hypothetical protein
VPSANAGLAASTLHRVVNLPSFSSSGRDFMVRFDLAVWPGNGALRKRACRPELLRFVFSRAFYVIFR